MRSTLGEDGAHESTKHVVMTRHQHSAAAAHGLSAIRRPPCIQASSSTTAQPKRAGSTVTHGHHRRRRLGSRLLGCCLESAWASQPRGTGRAWSVDRHGWKRSGASSAAAGSRSHRRRRRRRCLRSCGSASETVVAANEHPRQAVEPSAPSASESVDARVSVACRPRGARGSSCGIAWPSARRSR